MRLKIKNRTYDISYGELPENELGKCNCKSAKIIIDKNLDTQAIESTIRHELTHAYLFEYAVVRETYCQEDVCDLIGAYAGQIQKDTEKILKRRSTKKLLEE